jgi:hypothetical protein
MRVERGRRACARVRSAEGSWFLPCIVRSHFFLSLDLWPCLETFIWCNTKCHGICILYTKIYRATLIDREVGIEGNLIWKMWADQREGCRDPPGPNCKMRGLVTTAKYTFHLYLDNALHINSSLETRKGERGTTALKQIIMEGWDVSVVWDLVAANKIAFQSRTCLGIATLPNASS